VQATLTQTISFEGVGLHSGAPVTMSVHPAAARFGIWFKRTDITDADNMIRAIYTGVGAKPL